MSELVLIEKLTDVLRKEASLYEDFLSVQKGKTDILVKGNVLELEKMVKTEQSYFEKIQELESEREQIIERIAQVFHTDLSTLTLTQIINNYVNQEQASELKNLRDKILNTVNELKKVNEQNARLINNSLEYINFSINLIASANNGGSRYEQDGKEGKGERKSFFDIRL